MRALFQPFFKNFWPHPYTLLSGLLIVAAFPPWDITPLIWIALVPFWLALHRTPSTKAAIREGFWLQLTMTLAGFPWIAYTLNRFGFLPMWLAIILLVFFSLINQPQFWIAAWVFAKGWKKIDQKLKVAPYVAAAFALFYAGLDYVLPKLFADTLGHAFYRSPWGAQAADLAGVPLLTFFAVLFSLLIFQAIQNRSRKHIYLALLTLITPYLYGAIRLKNVERWMESPRATVHAGLIQANIGDFEKLAAESGIRGASDRVLETFFRLSDQALALNPKPDLLVWPETSYPSTFRTPQTPSELMRDQTLETFVRARNVPVLFGGYDRDERKDFNSFFLLSPHPEISGIAGLGQGAAGAGSGPLPLSIYHKTILLLFGEYIPFMEHSEFLMRNFPQIGNFGRGPGAQSIPLYVRGGGLEIFTSPIICYEILFPQYLIDAARLGTEIIINITNDSWFGDLGEPEIHLALSAFRSIETRLPQLRSTNTGISALIEPSGAIPYRSKKNVEETLVVPTRIYPPKWTLIKATGSAAFPVTAFVVGLGLLVFWYRRKLA